LISIKKYLDRNDPALTVAEPEPDELLAVTMDSYRSALHAFGSNAVEACPAPGRDLEHGLVKLESRSKWKRNWRSGATRPPGI